MKELPDITATGPVYKIFNFISQPIAVTKLNGEIVWTNSYFLRFFKHIKRPSDINEFIKLPPAIENKAVTLYSDKLKTNIFIQPVTNNDKHELITIIETNDDSKLEQNFLNLKLKGFAHDLNNILSNILNSIDVLKSKISKDDQNRELIENISNNSNRAIEIVSSLLNIEDDPIVQKRRIGVNSLLKDLARAFKLTLPEDIEFKLDLEKNLNDIYGNYTNLYSALLNLCVNAKESINNSGVITVSSANEIIDKKIETNNGVIRAGQYVVISVKDNGSGIPENLIDKIFDRGFTTKIKNYSGGIGLDNVKNIIEEHNGLITVSSETGKGTEFTVYFPAVEKKQSGENHSGKTILITEDEKALASLLYDLFESYHYNVISASSCEETLDKLKHNKIDLLLIDKELPDINGVECIKKMKEKGFNFAVVLSTGSIDESDKKQWSMFANGYLQKPYNFEKALSIVRELIG